MNQHTIENALQRAISYEEYRELINKLREENRTTSDQNSEAMLYYTDLNIARMDKWDKRFELSEDVSNLLKSIKKPEVWLVLTEGWCGDAAHALPVMAEMVKASDNIQLKLVLREQNLDLMDQYLTNGGRSIPKLIRLDAETLEEMGTWGPRPKEAQEIFTSLKEAAADKEEINKALQLWYARNRGKAIEAELAQMLAYQLAN